MSIHQLALREQEENSVPVCHISGQKDHPKLKVGCTGMSLIYVQQVQLALHTASLDSVPGIASLLLSMARSDS